MQKLVRWLAIADKIDFFNSSWGSMCRPQHNENISKWLLPLGWESELEARGIDFEVIEIAEDEEGNLIL